MGAKEVDFSIVPAPIRDLILDGLQFQRDWLTVLFGRTEHYFVKWSAGLHGNEV